MARTRDEKRAQFAYDKLKQLSQRGLLKKVKQRAQGLPVEVRTQGLSIVVATLIKEDRGECTALAQCLAEWLLGESGLGKSSYTSKELSLSGLLDHVLGCARSEYLMLQAEALAFLEHVKRLASALEGES